MHTGSISPLEILHTYGRCARIAHERTNCVTEVLLPEAEKWANECRTTNGPLAGIPVSLKDSIIVGGFDTTVAYAQNANKPASEDGIMVKILKKAGAVPYVKTALPITLLSFESSNSLWGVARNPHNDRYSPGGSTGGEAALLALNGSRIGIGSDVAGSVRLPAAWSGICSLRCSTGRWPKSGTSTSMPGQEGIPSVFSPMARTLDDLTYFTKALLQMEPWEVDYTVHPLPWRQHLYDEICQKQSLRIGVLRSDGVVEPTPAISRALDTAVSALESGGHTIVDITPADFPQLASPLEGLKIASKLLCADGGKTFMSPTQRGEWNDRGAEQIRYYMSLPRPVKYIHYLWIRYVKRDPIWASLLRGFHPLSAFENWKWVAKRETFRAKWFDWLTAEGQQFDFLICPVNATPALPHDAMHDTVSSCGYTFLFNLLDYSAGVIPVTKVDVQMDRLENPVNITNGVMAGAYQHYDAAEMAGLPCAVQIVGGAPRRLSEEVTLAAMKVVSEALDKANLTYEHLHHGDENRSAAARKHIST